jgi:hypothetical protein
LDSAAVFDAVYTAMMAEGLPPDVAVRTVLPPPDSGEMRVEVDVHSEGEIRMMSGYSLGRDRAPTCVGESKWMAQDQRFAALWLSHWIRTKVECAKNAYKIRWQ